MNHARISHLSLLQNFRKNGRDGARPSRRRRRQPVFDNGGTRSVASAGVLQKAHLSVLFLLQISALHVAAQTICSCIPPDQVVRAALSHSFALRSADHETEAARQRYDQAAAQALPVVDLKMNAAHYEGLEDSALGPNLVIPAISDRYAASVGITQPLYTGGRIDALKESSTFQQSAAENARRGTRADIMLQALAAYWNWSKAFYSANALQASVARMEAHATDMRNQYQAGLATENDKLATEVLLDQTRLRLESARRRVDITRARIAFLTGQDLPADSVPEAAIVPRELAVPPEADSLALARTNRPERTARVMEGRSFAALVTASRAERRPQVFLTSRYEWAQPNSMFFPPEEEWNEDAFAAVAINWTLLDWGLLKAKAAEAAIRSAQADLRLAQTEESIALEVKEARIGLQDALERVKVADRVTQSAQRNLEAATSLWQGGLARHSDVLDAHAQLTDTQNEVITARADAALAKAALEHALGTPNESNP